MFCLWITSYKPIHTNSADSMRRVLSSRWAFALVLNDLVRNNQWGTNFRLVVASNYNFALVALHLPLGRSRITALHWIAQFFSCIVSMITTNSKFKNLFSKCDVLVVTVCSINFYWYHILHSIEIFCSKKNMIFLFIHTYVQCKIKFYKNIITNLMLF